MLLKRTANKCLHLTQQMENVDTFASHGVFLARLMLAQGRCARAVVVLEEAEAFVHRQKLRSGCPQLLRLKS